MAQKCGACRSGEVQALADNYRCLKCGEFTDYEGNIGARKTTETVVVDSPHTT